MPSSWAARTTRRNASTPRRWPSARGKPRAAAHRPLPSMMTATCNGPSLRSGASLTGAAAFDISQFLKITALDGEDFLFLGRQQLIDLRDRAVGRLLHVVGKALLIVLRNLVVLLKLLDGVKTIAADVTHRDLGGFGIFVRDLHQFLAALLVEFRNPQTKHLPLGRGREAQIGIDDRLFNGLDHRLVPDLNRDQPRLGHADGGQLI